MKNQLTIKLIQALMIYSCVNFVNLCSPNCLNWRIVTHSVTVCDECPDGYYAYDIECRTCDVTCETCRDRGAEMCLTCASGKIRTNPGATTSACADGLACHGSCSTCTSSSDPNTCTSCSNPDHKISPVNGAISGTCVADCGPQRYKGTSLCEVCNQACDGCTGPRDVDCISCKFTQSHKYYRCSHS